MKKKILFSILTIIAIILFSITYSYATNEIEGAVDNTVNGVRNFVGGAENVVEDTASGIGNGIRNTVNGAENMTTGAMQTMDNNNGDYTATRTATARSVTNNATFLGMGATAWAWLIMAILGIVTVALVWYYGKQHEFSANDNDDNY